MHSVLLKLQESVARQLIRKRELRGIPILIRRNGELSQRLDEAVRAGQGVCIVIMPPEPAQAAIDASTLVMTEVILVVRVMENAFAANPRHDALSVAEAVSRLLHGWSPPVRGIATPLALEPDDAWDMPDEPDKKGRFAINVNFNTSATM